MNTQATFKASADWLGNGAVEVPWYQQEIYDLIRRESVELQRFNHIPATGDPHRYFEETAIGTAQFDNKRSLAPTPTNITRADRSAVIKCIDNQTNITLYDKEVTQQQRRFAQVVAKDIEDTSTAVILASASAVWAGTDTSLITPTTNQYVGLLNQITQQSVIAPGASIIDGLKAEVAFMLSNVTYKVRPTSIWVNPLLGDYLDREAKAQQITFGKTEVVAGVVVKTLSTQAGDLPIISSPFMPTDTTGQHGFSNPPAGNKNYYAVILSERSIEMPYISGETENPYPRLFQLGLVNSLSGQYVSVLFDCIVAKGASYAHSVVAVQRP